MLSVDACEVNVTKAALDFFGLHLIPVGLELLLGDRVIAQSQIPTRLLRHFSRGNLEIRSIRRPCLSALELLLRT